MQVFAPIVQLSSGKYVLYSTCTFFEYAAYLSNVNYVYNRTDPKATIFLAPREVEGVEKLKELAEKARDSFSVNSSQVLAQIPESVRPPEGAEWIKIGDSFIDGNLFTPYAITANGFQLLLHTPLPVNPISLELASDAAFDHAKKGFILLDTSKPIKLGEDIFPVEWIKSVIGHILTITQTYTNGFVVDTLEDAVIVRDPSSNFLQEVTDERREEIIGVLSRLFRRGTISLEPSSKFIGNWELSEGIYSGVYHPTWRNTLVTSSPTEYLLEAHRIYAKEEKLATIKRADLEGMAMREAMKYIASPRVNGSYHSALENVYNFYSATR